MKLGVDDSASILMKYIPLLADTYPDIQEWLYLKVIPDLTTGKRVVLSVADNEEIMAFSVLKDNKTEKKICTLYVLESFRLRGVGSLLIHESVKYLGHKNIHLSVSEDNYESIKSLLEKHGFNKVKEVRDEYCMGITELHFEL
ncbi:GNAT family N-acetyltransferase [Pseudomonas luteola]